MIPPDAADKSLTPERRETLRALVDMLVPASDDARMPAAADMPTVLQHVEQFAAAQPVVRDGLDRLQEGAQARHGAGFATLDRANRATLLEEFAARRRDVLQRLAIEVVTCYYQQDRVLEGLGMEARPPYPDGYQVVSGDLTLLEHVTARGRIWRDAS